MPVNHHRPHNSGLFSWLLLASLPIASRLKQWQMDGITNHGCLKLVQFYQRQISPHKGFRCAHRALHQGVSCSAFFAINLQHLGLASAIPLQIERFQECRQANRLLQDQRQKQALRLNHVIATQHPSRKRKRNNQNSCDWLYWCDCDPLICDCDLLDIAECDPPYEFDCCDCG